MPRASNQLQHQSGSSVYHEARGADGSIASARSLKTIADCVDLNTDRLKVDIEDASGQGLATEAKQDEQIALLQGQTPALNRTKAIPVQIMVGDAGDNYDALRASGQDLLVMIDDMNPDVALNSGLARSDKQDTLNASLASVGTDELRVEVVSGTITETNSTAILADTGSLDTKIVTKAPITGDGTTSAQAVNIMGSADGNNFRTIKTDGNGAIIVDPSEGSIITADGVTQEQRVMICGNHSGNLRTVKVGDAGAVAMELDYSWDNTNEIFTNETVADAATITSATFDLGQGISHDLGNVEFFHTNSASVIINVTAEVSPDGTNWYSLNGASFVSGNQFVSHNQEEVGISIGHRYMRLVVENQDGTGTSTNITTKVAYYK